MLPDACEEPGVTSPGSDKSAFTLAEWSAIGAILLVWGINNAAAKVATGALPPLLVGGLRFAIALVVLLPFLKPPLPPLRQILPIVLLVGPLHFGLIYWGFSLIDNLSPMVVALQLWIPMTAFFAWRMLGERMSPAALAGMVVALVGVAWMSLDPHGAADLPGIALGVWLLGSVALFVPPIVGALRRGSPGLLLLVPLLPLYYALVSVAAWMAFYEYFNRRFVWNKTEHGLARQRAPIEQTTSDAAIPRPPAQEAARY